MLESAWYVYAEQWPAINNISMHISVYIYLVPTACYQ